LVDNSLTQCAPDVPMNAGQFYWVRLCGWLTGMKPPFPLPLLLKFEIVPWWNALPVGIPLFQSFEQRRPAIDAAIKLYEWPPRAQQSGFDIVCATTELMLLELFGVCSCFVVCWCLLMFVDGVEREINGQRDHVSFMEKKVVLFHITCQQKPCTFSRRNWQLGLVGQIGVHKPKTKEKKNVMFSSLQIGLNFSSYSSSKNPPHGSFFPKRQCFCFILSQITFASSFCLLVALVCWVLLLAVGVVEIAFLHLLSFLFLSSSCLFFCLFSFLSFLFFPLRMIIFFGKSQKIREKNLPKRKKKWVLGFVHILNCRTNFWFFIFVFVFFLYFRVTQYILI